MTRALAQEQSFAHSLYQLAGEDRADGDKERKPDRAALASLRRGLGRQPGDAIEMFGYVVPNAPTDGRTEDEYFTVAALFGLHSGHLATDANENIGASLGRLRSKVKSDQGLSEKEEPGGVEARLRVLLRGSSKTLPGHLRGVISLLKAREIPVDYAQLLHDLRQFRWDQRSVRREWATSFWRRTASAEVPDDTSGSESANTDDEERDIESAQNEMEE